jgi:hypothetical protein
MKSLEVCPGCGAALAAGFAARANGLSFVSADKFEQFAFIDEDLSDSGLLRKLLPSKAEYYRSFVCRSCKLYLIDFSAVLDRAQAECVAESEVRGASPRDLA